MTGPRPCTLTPHAPAQRPSPCPPIPIYTPGRARPLQTPHRCWQSSPPAWHPGMSDSNTACTPAQRASQDTASRLPCPECGASSASGPRPSTGEGRPSRFSSCWCCPCCRPWKTVHGNAWCHTIRQPADSAGAAKQTAPAATQAPCLRLPALRFPHTCQACLASSAYRHTTTAPR